MMGFIDYLGIGLMLIFLNISNDYLFEGVMSKLEDLEKQIKELKQMLLK